MPVYSNTVQEKNIDLHVANTATIIRHKYNTKKFTNDGISKLILIMESILSPSLPYLKYNNFKPPELVWVASI